MGKEWISGFDFRRAVRELGRIGTLLYWNKMLLVRFQQLVCFVYSRVHGTFNRRSTSRRSIHKYNWLADTSIIKGWFAMCHVHIYILYTEIYCVSLTWVFCILPVKLSRLYFLWYLKMPFGCYYRWGGFFSIWGFLRGLTQKPLKFLFY